MTDIRPFHIDIPDNERTEAIDGRFRPQQTAEALGALLSSGYTRPVAMVAEDGQWLDEASRALLDMIGKAARDRPWTVLITARTTGDFSPLGDEVRLGLGAASGDGAEQVEVRGLQQPAEVLGIDGQGGAVDLKDDADQDKQQEFQAAVSARAAWIRSSERGSRTGIRAGGR